MILSAATTQSSALADSLPKPGLFVVSNEGMVKAAPRGELAFLGANVKIVRPPQNGGGSSYGEYLPWVFLIVLIAMIIALYRR